MQNVNEEMFSTALNYGMNKIADRIEADDSAPSRMIRYMQKGEYASAAKVAEKKKLTSDSEFEKVVVFGKAHGVRYPKIMGGMACLAASVVGESSIEKMADTIERAFTELFVKGKFGDGGVFDQTCGDAKHFKGCVGFMLTKDGASVPKNENDSDSELIKFFQKIKKMSGGLFVLKDFQTKRFLVKGGFIETVKYLIGEDMIEIGRDAEMLVDGADVDMALLIKHKAAHKFRLHEPQLVIDEKTGRPSNESELYEYFMSLGYDMTSEREQSVTLDNASAVVDKLYAVYSDYIEVGENISDNPFERCLKMVSSQIMHLYANGARPDEIAMNEKRQIDEYKGTLEKSVNSLLQSLGLPKISIMYDKSRIKVLNGMDHFITRSWSGDFERRDIRRDDSRHGKDHHGKDDGGKSRSAVGKAMDAVGNAAKAVAKSDFAKDLAKDAAKGIVNKVVGRSEKQST